MEGRANYLIKILLRFDGVGDLVLLTLQGLLACAEQVLLAQARVRHKREGSAGNAHIYSIKKSVTRRLNSDCKMQPVTRTCAGPENESGGSRG